MERLQKSLAWALLQSTLLLVACGGGGSSSGPINQPPNVPTVTISPTVPGPTQTVSLSATSSDPEGQAISFRWDFGDGSTGTGSSVTHVYANPGTFTIAVTASDPQGAISTTSQTLSIVNQAPTNPVITAASTSPVLGVTANFSASSSDPENQALTVAWDFGDGGTSSGTAVTHAFASFGTFTVAATARDPFGATGRSTITITVSNRSPSLPAITAPAVVTPGRAVTFVATSSDPEGQTINYAWQFSDGGSAVGSTVAHTFANEGGFTARVVATDPQGASAENTTQVTATYPAPSSVVATASVRALYPKQIASWQATAIDPSGLSMSYSWSFGDGSTATGPIVRHAFNAAGNYDVRLTARNSANKSTTISAPLVVLAPVQPNALDNTWQVYCSDVLCGATDANTYDGRGVGVWRYHNATAAAQTISIRIAGVSQGQSAELLFSNGRAIDSTALPSAGSTASAGQTIQKALVGPGIASDPKLLREQWMVEHLGLLDRQRAWAAQVSQRPRLPSSQGKRVSPVARFKPLPALGTTRIWYDNNWNALPYTEVVVEACALPSGRNAVFWLEQSLINNNTAKFHMARMRETYCGPPSNPAIGTYAKLTALVGDVWGPAANNLSYVIHDGPVDLQDINIIVFGAPEGVYGAYFAAGDVFIRFNGGSDYSNDALVIGINSSIITDPFFVNWLPSTLAHETMHMINWYQRTVTRGAYHSRFVEEMTALMAEDIVARSVLQSIGTDYYPTERFYGAVPGAGGRFSLSNFDSPYVGTTYGMAATFGTFMNRRYGTTIFQQLIPNCDGLPTTTQSWDCLDQRIRSAGGRNIADEFALLGVSMYGLLRSRDLPWGFGFAPTQLGEIEFPAMDSARYKNDVPLSSIPTDVFLAGSQAVLREIFASGQTQYRRDNVVVPPNTTLMLVITTLD